MAIGPGPECASGNVFPQLGAFDIRAVFLASCGDLLRWTPLSQVTEINVCCSAFSDGVDSLQALVDMSSLISSQYKLLEFFWFYFLRHLPCGATLCLSATYARTLPSLPSPQGHSISDVL